MQYKTLKSIRRSKGFGLVEVLIVLFILAIGAFFIVGTGGGAADDQRVAAGVRQVLDVKNALELFKVQNNGTYTGLTGPSDLAGLIADKRVGNGTGTSSFGSNITAVPANSNTDATVTIGTPNSDACQGLLKGTNSMSNIRTAPTCSGANLYTVVFD